MNVCRTWIAKCVFGVDHWWEEQSPSRDAAGGMSRDCHTFVTLCLPPIHQPKLRPCKVLLVSTYLRKKTDSVNEAEQTELSSPPFDSISSTQFSPFNSAHLLVSSWDAVSFMLY